MRERRFKGMRYPDWLRMPDQITEHCECCFQYGPNHGRHKHCRSWTLAQVLRVWEQRPKHG
jgi:hypothetical protein